MWGVRVEGRAGQGERVQHPDSGVIIKAATSSVDFSVL